MNTASIVLVATGAVLLNIIMGIFERKTTKGAHHQNSARGFFDMGNRDYVDG